VDGKIFDTLKSATKFYGVKYVTARSRIKRGWTIEQAMGLEAPPNKNRPIKFRGKSYESEAAISQEFGVRVDVFRQRLAKGHSIEVALGIRDLEYKTKPLACVVRGQQFASRNEAAKHFGVDKGTVATRVNKLGWTLEQALELEPRPGYDKNAMGCVYAVRHKISGKTYIGITRQHIEPRFQQHIKMAFSKKSNTKGSLAEAIRKEGPENFEISMLVTGYSMAELQDLERKFIRERKTLAPIGYNLKAGGGGLHTPGRPLTIKGEFFESAAAAARAYGVNPLVVNERLRRGYSAEQAVGLEPLEWVHPRSISVVIDSIEFETLKDAANHFGHPPSRVRSRISKGWSVEDALKKPFSGRARPSLAR
jgi:hypothetical protein